MFERNLSGLHARFFDGPSEFISAARNVNREWNATWMGGTRESCARKIETGDNALVPRSDDLLSKLEDKFNFLSNGIKIVDSVAGGVPNVPALLSGHPMSMRRRQKMANPLGPLTIVVDITSSSGCEDDELTQRGVSVLALARLLAGRRPITLWVGTGLSDRGCSEESGKACFYRLDTTPIDLARAAHIFCNPGVARGFGYGYLQDNMHAGGGWPYGDVKLWREKGQRLISEMLGEEVLFVPPIFYKDDITERPEKWLTDMISRYGGGVEE